MLPPSHSHTYTGTQTADGDSGIRVAGFLPYSQPQRRSITQYSPSSSGYYNAFPYALTSHLPTGSASPPSYCDIFDQPLPPARFKILPREEEGKEQLPAYSCSLHKEGVLHRKMELSTPFDRAPIRQWRKHYLILHGTLLKVHKVRRAPFFGRFSKSDTGQDGVETPKGYFPGELLKGYTLQGAEVGIAGDYISRNFVIRIRVETEQFLLSARKIEDFLEWLEVLSAAVDISPSLDERSLPRYQTLPRRRRRRRGTQGVGEQQRIIEGMFLGLAERGGNENRSENANSAADSINTEEIGANAHTQGLRTEASEAPFLTVLSSEPTVSGAQPENHSPQLPCRSFPLSRNIASTRPFNISPFSNLFNPDGKWSPPPHTLTREANMDYARRCMAVLYRDAPRHSNHVVCDGKRYKLIYETKTMVLDEVSNATVAKGSLVEEKEKEKREINGRSVMVIGGRGTLKNIIFNMKGKGKGKDKEKEKEEELPHGVEHLMKMRLPSYNEIFEDVKVNADERQPIERAMG